MLVSVINMGLHQKAGVSNISSVDVVALILASKTIKYSHLHSILKGRPKFSTNMNSVPDNSMRVLWFRAAVTNQSSGFLYFGSIFRF